MVTLDGRRTEVRWDRAAYEYLATVRWDAHGPLLGVQSRDQRTLLTLAADPDTGDTRVLAETRDAHWTRLVPGTPARTASGALLRVANDTATDTYRLLRDGEPVSPAGLQVRAVLGVAGERVLFTAAEDPAERHVWSYEPGPGCTPLTEERGHHTAAAAWRDDGAGERDARRSRDAGAGHGPPGRGAGLPRRGAGDPAPPAAPRRS